MQKRMKKGSGTIMIRTTMTARQRLQAMARADGTTPAMLLHLLVTAEWLRRALEAEKASKKEAPQ